MSSITVVPFQTTVPDWLALAVVLLSVALAIATLSLMLVRVRPAAGEDGDSRPAAARDPMLLISALAVIVLAIAAWLLR
jgi:hypothetical protein